MTRTHARRAVIGAAVAIAYVAAAMLGFRVAFVAEQVSTVWAPTGIAQAALILWGRSLWPAIWLGAFTANAWVGASIGMAIAVACGNTLEAVAAAWILGRFFAFDPALRRTRSTLAFIGVAVIGSTTISATIGVAALCAAGEQPWIRFREIWLDWWLGDAVGAVVVAPAILTIARTPARLTGRQWSETSLLVLGTIVAAEIVFGQIFGPTVGRRPLEFVIFPFVIAAAVRLTQPATSLVVLGASGVTILNTVQGIGPFSSDEVHHSLVLLQVFMGVLAGTGLLLAAAMAEWRTSERRRAAAHAVSNILTDARSLEAAAPDIVDAIRDNLEWPHGALWLVDRELSRIRCVTVRGGTSPAAVTFTKATSEMLFARGVGLPGRVWESGKPAWIVNVVSDSNFPRAHVAAAADYHGAFAFPIAIGAEVVGVIECFNRFVVAADLDLLSTMSIVGNQIGQFVARKRGEAAVLDAQGEREQLLQRELAARREAEAANRAKDEFLATLSHELRTPLNAIVGWTRMLLDHAMDERSTRRALEIIDRNANLQVKLVADILDVSRIITGGLRLDLKPLDLGSVVGAALDAVRPAAEARRIRLRSRIAESIPLIEGDPQRVQQIVWNLLANAVKFTPAGGQVSIELYDPGGERVCIRVQDDGDGIDPEFLPHVFERFRQADGSASREHGGLGLGLAIVRHLVELHGGSVAAQSPGRGKGSTFLVELPKTDIGMDWYVRRSRPEDDVRVGAEVSSGDVRPLSGCTLLVVEDDEDARELLSTALSAAGASVRTASSVDEALTSVDEQWPDVLLADIGLPGEDGYSLIREMRMREIDRRPLVAAALTAYAQSRDRERAIAAGFDRHFAKPMDPVKVVEAVRLLWAPGGSEPIA
jgi:signal transduction histidine kinase/integral membrane sensor domain MASE1